MMSEEEVRKAAKYQIEKMNATSMADMGKVMGVLMSELERKADGALISRVVKEELS